MGHFNEHIENAFADSQLNYVQIIWMFYNETDNHKMEKTVIQH